MATFRRVIKAVKDYLQKGKAGDIAYLKIELLHIRGNSNSLNKLRDITDYYPKIDLEKLAQLPKGTLGYEYARHMKQQGIQPLEISPDLKEEAPNPFALRYTLTHDLFHVLLGFDTSYAGEMGVFGFTVGQNYSKMLKIAEPIVLLIFCFIAPHKIKQIWKCDREGKALGKQAKCLLLYPFEENWARGIDDVRAEVGLIVSKNLQVEEIARKKNDFQLQSDVELASIRLR